MSCATCDNEEAKAKTLKLIEDAKVWGRDKGKNTVALVKRPNGSVFFTGSDDPRCQRLAVIEYLSVS